MKAELRDMVRATAKTRRPKPEAKPARVKGIGFTQHRGPPFPGKRAAHARRKA